MSHVIWDSDVIASPTHSRTYNTLYVWESPKTRFYFWHFVCCTFSLRQATRSRSYKSAARSRGMLKDLSPSDIRFMHRQINPRFKGGRSLNATVDQIASGQMSVYALPTIRVVQRNDRYYALDNRRLYVYRERQAGQYPGERGGYKFVSTKKVVNYKQWIDYQFQQRIRNTIPACTSFRVRGHILCCNLFFRTISHIRKSLKKWQNWLLIKKHHIVLE